MTIVLKNLIKDTSTTEGLGPITLAGASVAPYQGFGAIGDGSETIYSIAMGADVEARLGIVGDGGTTLTRGLLIWSSTGDPIDFGPGEKTVICGLPAELALVHVGETPPDVAVEGHRWFDPVTRVLSIYADGGDGLAWLAVVPPGYSYNDGNVAIAGTDDVAGGAVDIFAGNGAANETGTGGDISFRGGNAGTGNNQNGAYFQASGGSGVDRRGGEAGMFGGEGDMEGGDATIYAGSAFSEEGGEGGSVGITAGAGYAAGGDIRIDGGYANGPEGFGGGVEISGGAGADGQYGHIALRNLPTAPSDDNGALWDDNGTVKIGPASGGATVALLSARVEVSSAEILALSSSPVELVAAPGAGKMIRIVEATAIYVPGLMPYLTNDNAPYLFVGDPDEDGLAFSQYDILLSSDESRAFLLLVNGTDSATSYIDNAAAFLFADADPVASGGLATASVASAGTGYAEGDTGRVLGGYGGNATYTVLTVGGGGEVLTFSVDTPGAGYATGVECSTGVDTGTGDEGFTVTVDTISDPSDGTLVIDLLYRIVDLP